MSNQHNVKIIIEAVDRSAPALKELGQKLDGLKNKSTVAADSMGGAFSTLGGKLAGLAGIIAGVGLALKATVTSVAAAGEQLFKLSQNTGISVDSLARMKKAAELSEGSLEELVGALQKMQAQLGKGGAADGEFADALAAIGLGAKELQALKPEEQLLKIARAMSEYENGTNKVAVAKALFGRAGAQTIAMLNQLGEAFDEANTTWTEEAAKAADDFGDNMRRMEHNLSSIKTRIGNEVIPALNTFLELLQGKELKFEWLTSLGIKLSRVAIAFDEARARALSFIGLEKMAEAARESAARGRERMAGLEGELREMQSPQSHVEVKKKLPPIKDRGAARTDALALMLLELQDRRNFLKQSESIASEMMGTLQKQNELTYAKLEITQREFYDNKARLELDALEQSIAYLAEERAAIEASWAARNRLYKDGKERTDAERAVKKEISDIDTEIAKKREKMTQSSIDSTKTEIGLTKELAQAKRNGELRVLEQQIELQRELIRLKQDRGLIGGLDAERQQMELQRDAIEARIAKTREAMESSPVGSAEYISATAEIDAMAVSLEAVAEILARIKQQQEGTFGEGFLEGIRRFKTSIGTAFEEGRELATGVATAMRDAFSDFFDVTSQGFLNFRNLVSNIFGQIASMMARMLMNKAIGGLFASLGISMAHQGGLIMHAGGLVPRYHTGGLARDERPAILQAGEFVIQREAVRSVGTDTLGEINKTGKVGAGAAQDVTIVNVLDESLLHKALGSRAGKRIIMNYIREAQR